MHDERFGAGSPLRGLQVEPDGLLTPIGDIEAGVEQGHRLLGGRRDGPFDTNDLRAEISDQHAAVRRWPNGAELDDPPSRKRPLRHRDSPCDGPIMSGSPDDCQAGEASLHGIARISLRRSTFLAPMRSARSRSRLRSTASTVCDMRLPASVKRTMRTRW